MERLHLVHVDLEVHPAPVGVAELLTREETVMGERLLDHDLRALPLQVSEALGRPLVQHAEAEHAGVEAEAATEVAADQLGDEAWPVRHAAPPYPS